MTMYTAETYTVLNTGETGWCIKYGDDTLADVYEGEDMARYIAEALNEGWTPHERITA